MIILTKRTRHSSTNTSTGKSYHHPELSADRDDDPPSLLQVQDDSSDDDSKQTSSSKRHRHRQRRSLSQKLRLFFLTQQQCYRILILKILTLMGSFCALFNVRPTELLSCWNAETPMNGRVIVTASTITVPDRTRILQEAGFAAKPIMVGVYFDGVASDSFTHQVAPLKPEIGSAKPPPKQHRRKRYDPMIVNVDSLYIQKHIREDSEDYWEEKPHEQSHDYCVPQHDWQEQSYPVCNTIHEHSVLSDRILRKPIKVHLATTSSRDSKTKTLPPRRHLSSNTVFSYSVSSLRRRQLAQYTEFIPVDNDYDYNDDEDHDNEDEDDLHSQFKMLASGHWRDTWMVQEEESVGERNHKNKFAMKTLRYEHNVTEYILDKQRRDALTSDRAQFSDQTIDLYAYCGTSAAYEYAPGGDMEELFDYFDTAEEWRNYYSSKQRYLLAYNATRSLADLHNTEKGEENPTAIVHADFKPNQFVAVTKDRNDHKIPQYKLGDFNLARFLYWDEKHDRPCTINPEGTGGIVSAMTRSACNVVVFAAVTIN